MQHYLTNKQTFWSENFLKLDIVEQVDEDKGVNIGGEITYLSITIITTFNFENGYSVG